MNSNLGERWQKFWAALRIERPRPEAAALQRRQLTLERNIILPAKVAVVGILYHSFLASPWIGLESYSLDVAVEMAVSLFWIYGAVNVVAAVPLGLGRRLPPAITRAVATLMCLLDALVLAALTLLTGGLDSIVFWVFVVLIVRNALTEPLSPAQWLLHGWTASCYALAGVSEVVLARSVDEYSRDLLGLNPPGQVDDAIVVRTMLLLLVGACAFGVQVVLERQRRTEAEAREFGAREERLRSTGRLAAEIAHQLKNPLAIINNAAFSLQRNLAETGPAAASIRIIQEEVERSDRILTRLMDYARLNEGVIEKLDVPSELDAALAVVFPAAAEFAIEIRRDYPQHLPPLMMQRVHLREVLVNLLINAREAVGQAGQVKVEARALTDDALEIAVSDNGRGIPPEELGRIFEAYFTTKGKGTGLGLAIVKNHVELYGGTIQADSELGKGSRFRLTFPARISTGMPT